jgi:hypothetical protein
MPEYTHTDHPTERTPVEARSAIMTGHMRYVLAISTVLAAILLITLAFVMI